MLAYDHMSSTYLPRTCLRNPRGTLSISVYASLCRAGLALVCTSKSTNYVALLLFRYIKKKKWFLLSVAYFKQHFFLGGGVRFICSYCS